MENMGIASLNALGTKILDVLLGGWDMALEVLLIVMMFDYVTGVASAFKRKEVSSSKGYMGIIKKTSIFVIVILAAQMDRMTGGDNHLFRNGTAFFFAANDALSILENVGKLGVRMPAFLKNAFMELKEAYDESPLKNSDGDSKKTRRDK